VVVWYGYVVFVCVFVVFVDCMLVDCYVNVMLMYVVLVVVVVLIVVMVVLLVVVVVVYWCV